MNVASMTIWTICNLPEEPHAEPVPPIVERDQRTAAILHKPIRATFCVLMLVRASTRERPGNGGVGPPLIVRHFTCRLCRSW